MRWRQIWPVLLFGALLLLLVGSLVRGPEAAAEPETAREAAPAVRAVGVMPEEAGTQTPRQTEHSGRETLPPRACPAAPRVLCADRNGIPITGRTWKDTVYQVCPPEGKPG